jgi:hypothetical protein
MNRLTILDTKLTRDKYTKHGMHMNTSRKENMVKHIGQIMTNLLSKQQSSTITLQWNEECESTTPE